MIENMQASGNEFSQAELLRYARQLTIPEIGLAGQRKLKAASVLIVGAGGLGSVIGLYLASAGVGRIGLVDYDTVEPGNLQRQVLYDEGSIGSSKVEAACGRLRALNSEIRVEGIHKRLNAGNAHNVSSGFDILVDCSDNAATHYLVSDLCVLTRRPDVYGAASGLEGQVSVFDAQKGPCYRCLFPTPPVPEGKREGVATGILGTVAGTIGTLQAAEVIKLVEGTGDPLIGRMLLYHMLASRFEEIKIKKKHNCAICGNTPELTTLAEFMDPSGTAI